MEMDLNRTEDNQVLEFFHSANGFRGTRLEFGVTLNPKSAQIHYFSFVRGKPHVEEGFSHDFKHPLTKSELSSIEGINSFELLYEGICRKLFYPPIADIIDRTPYEKSQRELRATLIVIENAFIDTLNPTLAAIARKFSSDRWYIYRLLMANNHPRVLQFAETSPGVFGVMVYLANEMMAPLELMKPLFEMILNGYPLKDILEKLFEVVSRLKCPMWPEVEESAFSRMDEIKRDWFWKLTNATAEIDPYLLVLPPPLNLCKSDLPKNLKKRSLWFKQIHSLYAFILPEAYIDRIKLEKILGLSALISVAKKDLVNYIDKNQEATLLYLRVGEGTPNRKTNPRTLKHLIKEQAEVLKIQKNRLKIKKQMNNGMNRRIHHGDFVVEDEHFSIKALVFQADLRFESLVMKNCVFSQTQSAANKRIIHFHVIIKGRDYTLGINPNSSEWIDFKGYRNAKVAHDIKEFLEIKLSEHKEKLDQFLTLNRMRYL
jgi:hypothetical protein